MPSERVASRELVRTACPQMANQTSNHRNVDLPGDQSPQSRVCLPPAKYGMNLRISAIFWFADGLAGQLRLAAAYGGRGRWVRVPWVNCAGINRVGTLRRWSAPGIG